MAIQRLTRQRKAVLQVVQNTNTHPDAAWVYQEVRQLVPRISLGTVYRTLEALVSEGYLVPLAQAGQATRYDANTDHHPHMICQACGQIIDIELRHPELLDEAQRRFPQLEIRTMTVAFHGLCQQCRTAG